MLDLDGHLERGQALRHLYGPQNPGGAASHGNTSEWRNLVPILSEPGLLLNAS
jgi:hypothetical protein